MLRRTVSLWTAAFLSFALSNWSDDRSVWSSLSHWEWIPSSQCCMVDYPAKYSAPHQLKLQLQKIAMKSHSTVRGDHFWNKTLKLYLKQLHLIRIEDSLEAKILAVQPVISSTDTFSAKICPAVFIATTFVTLNTSIKHYVTTYGITYITYWYFTSNSVIPHSCTYQLLWYVLEVSCAEIEFLPELTGYHYLHQHSVDYLSERKGKMLCIRNN